MCIRDRTWAVVALRGGQDYPRSVGEFLSWFGTDADCRDYLAWLRWPDGFVCDECGHVDGWRLADGRWECAACSHRTSVTAGTIFDRTRTPLTVWFHACWLFATAKDGISALGLQRTLQIGSYQTAWAMLHRLRSVLIRPGRELLSGQVEVDETYFGGEEAGLAGGRAGGKKAVVAVAVEVRSPRVLGDVGCASFPMGLPARCTRSSPTTSPQGPPWSPTDGPVTWASTRSATPMIGAVNAPPRPWARTSASCCRECTASRPWPNGGCFPPTKARCTSSTCLVTWTSSASGSTVAAHAAAVWSSTGCSNWPSATTQSVTSSSLRAPSRRRSGRPLPETEATRLAWTAPAPDDPGATRPDEAKSAQMDSPELHTAEIQAWLGCDVYRPCTAQQGHRSLVKFS